MLAGVASGVALIFVAADGENMIGVASGANLRLTPDDVDRLPSSVFRPGDVLLASLEIPVETSIRALRRGIEAGMRTILNPAPAPTLSPSRAKELLSVATVITPNRVEALALALAGWKPDVGGEPDWAACGSCLMEMGPAAVVITLGSRGCQLVADKSLLIPAPEVEAIDTVGAGDAFNGALAVALAEGRPLEEAAQWANAAAALAVTRPGAQAALAFRDSIDQLAARVAKAN
jgi:ribokinase